MKKIIVALLVVFIIAVCLAPGVQQAVLFFLLAGLIPGTSLSIPPIAMIIILLAALFAVIHYTRRQQFHLPPPQKGPNAPEIIEIRDSFEKPAAAPAKSSPAASRKAAAADAELAQQTA